MPSPLPSSSVGSYPYVPVLSYDCDRRGKGFEICCAGRRACLYAAREIRDLRAVRPLCAL